MIFRYKKNVKGKIESLFHWVAWRPLSLEDVVSGK